MPYRLYNTLLLIFLAWAALIWIPWGLTCLFIPEAWSGQVIEGIDVFDLSGAVARTEVRAMYGGLQIAIGLLALIAIIKPRHRPTTLLFFVLALTGLAGSRFFGLIMEGSESYLVFSVSAPPEVYNQVGLAMYEFPHLILAWIVFLFQPAVAKI